MKNGIIILLCIFERTFFYNSFIWLVVNNIRFVDKLFKGYTITQGCEVLFGHKTVDIRGY